jgi:hypothetical protein
MPDRACRGKACSHPNRKEREKAGATAFKNQQSGALQPESFPTKRNVYGRQRSPDNIHPLMSS